MICVGTDLETSKQAVELAQRYDFIWAAVGFHPSHVVSSFDDPNEGTKAALRSPFDINTLEKLAEHPRVVGIGECGLDYFRVTSDKQQETSEKQKEIFIDQIGLAQKLKKPLVVHCRPSVRSQDAYEDLLQILVTCRLSRVSTGVVHFFVGNKDIAHKFLDLGFYIAFAGPITFAEEYEEVVRYVPLDRILIETDAPYAAPAPYRGKRNEPTYVIEVARKTAELKGLPLEEIINHTTQNAIQLFRLKS